MIGAMRVFLRVLAAVGLCSMPMASVAADMAAPSAAMAQLQAAADAVFFAPTAPAKPAKKVFAHYMLCCPSFGDSVEALAQEIKAAQAMGLDGFALNAGEWRENYRDAAARMFAAAGRLNSGFRLFFSADMCCGLTAADILDMVRTYAGHANYLHREGRPVLSTYVGEDRKTAFWQTQVRQPLRDVGIDVFFVPAFDPVTAGGQPANEVAYWGDAVDGMFFFGPAATPFGSRSSVAANEAYARALAHAGKLFMAGYYAFYWGNDQPTAGRRYFEYQGGLGTETQWRSIVEVQDPEWVEIVTWNDFNESYLVAPAKDPTGFFKPHLAFIALNKYYVHWFKTGVAPKIVKDALFYFYRTHPRELTAPHDPQGPVTRLFGNVKDVIYVTVALTAPARLHVGSGQNRFDFPLGPGFNQVSVPFAAGDQRFELWRGDKRISAIAGEPVVAKIVRYDFFYSSGFVETEP